jgi:predicted Zn-dependent protease
VGFERVAAPAAAALAYRSALLRWPGDLSLQMGLGNSLHAQGERSAAAQAFRDATVSHPDSAPAWINLAATLVDTGRPVDALRAAERAVDTRDAAWRAQAEAVVLRARAALMTAPVPVRSTAH